MTVTGACVRSTYLPRSVIRQQKGPIMATSNHSATPPTPRARRSTTTPAPPRVVAPVSRSRPNIVALRGVIAEPPSTRQLATGEISEATVLTRSIVDGKVVREPVPVVWVGSMFEFAAGADVIVRGRVRQRFYRSGSATISRTEVVAEEIVLASRRPATVKLLDRAAHAVHELGGAR